MRCETWMTHSAWCTCTPPCLVLLARASHQQRWKSACAPYTHEIRVGVAIPTTRHTLTHTHTHIYTHTLSQVPAACPGVDSICCSQPHTQACVCQCQGISLPGGLCHTMHLHSMHPLTVPTLVSVICSTCWFVCVLVCLPVCLSACCPPSNIYTHAFVFAGRGGWHASDMVGATCRFSSAAA
jgi:hypothetical protein